MCMQCVRADRREAEGRPARWQIRPRVLFLPAGTPPPDAAITLAELEGALDVTRHFRDVRWDRASQPYPGRTVKTDTSPKAGTLVLTPASPYRGRGA